MIWDWLVQRTGKYCSIRRIEYPEFQTGIFGRMESAPGYTIHILYYAGVSIMPPRVLASEAEAKTLRGQ